MKKISQIRSKLEFLSILNNGLWGKRLHQIKERLCNNRTKISFEEWQMNEGKSKMVLIKTKIKK
jgi:hypothetical protein